MPPYRPAGGLKGRLRSPVAGIPQIQILAMLDSMAFFRGRILWITRLHVCQWVAYIRVRVAKVQVHQTHHQRAHQNTTHTLANFREVIVAVRRCHELTRVLRLQRKKEQRTIGFFALTYLSTVKSFLRLI